ncbi:MAG: hypothetical protein DMD91_08325 [Candidatus Rokuibacteriota bacterium]|nr:MAG: hypothetical protein DMD91_08325 [Candidatus Rokubacteria bacterium]
MRPRSSSTARSKCASTASAWTPRSAASFRPSKRPPTRSLTSRCSPSAWPTARWAARSGWPCWARSCLAASTPASRSTLGVDYGASLACRGGGSVALVHLLIGLLADVVFDKTGTLTSGTPRVARVVCHTRALDEDALIRLVAAAEHGFQHPIARAVRRLAADRKLSVPAATTTASQIGLGVDVTVEGRHVLIGSRRFMESRHVGLAAAEADERAAHGAGGAATFVAVDGELAGLLVLQDELRPEAREAVSALKARRMRDIVLLTGDHPEPSRAIAELLGLRNHYAELSPDEKAKLIHRLKREGHVVAMVGDGVNDALALEEADVGIAVPGGAEVASAAADVVIMSGGLDRVVRALDLAAETIAAVRRTVNIAAQANLGVVGLASFGLAKPLASILLTHGITLGAAIITTRQPAQTRSPRRRRPALHKNVRRSSSN